MSAHVPRQVNDIVMRWLAGSHADDLAAVLGLDIGAIAGPAPTALPLVEVLDREMHYLFSLISGEYFHLEFQDEADPATLRRFLLYDTLLFARDGRRVHTAVVYTGAVGHAPDRLDGGSLTYRVQNAYLQNFDADQTLAELRRKVDSGERPNRRDGVRLALMPLMRLAHGRMEDAAASALELLRAWGEGHERATLAAAVIGLSHRFLQEDAVRRLLQMARTTTPFDDLLAEVAAKGWAEGEAKGRVEGRAEGRVEGEAKGRADALLHVLRGRFGEPDAGVAARVRGQGDLDKLDRWLDLALRGASMDDFLRGLDARR